MNSQTLILLAIAAVFFVLYMLRRRSRLTRNDD